MIDAGAVEVWGALTEMRMADLRVSVVLIALRGLGGSADLQRRLVDPPSPAAPIMQTPPSYLTSAMIGQPWQARPVLGPTVTDLSAFAQFCEPGWLKYGMEFQLTALPDGQTLVETATMCEATDGRAQRRFALYGAVIRPFSGLIRRDILSALARCVTRPA